MRPTSLSTFCKLVMGTAAIVSLLASCGPSSQHPAGEKHAAAAVVTTAEKVLAALQLSNEDPGLYVEPGVASSSVRMTACSDSLGSATDEVFATYDTGDTVPIGSVELGQLDDLADKLGATVTSSSQQSGEGVVPDARLLTMFLTEGDLVVTITVRLEESGAFFFSVTSDCT